MTLTNCYEFAVSFLHLATVFIAWGWLLLLWRFGFACISEGVKQRSMTAQGVHKFSDYSIRHSGSGIDMIERFQDLGTQSGVWHLYTSYEILRLPMPETILQQ